MRALLVLNPGAGRGRAGALAGDLEGLFRDRGFDPRVVPTAGPGDAAAIVEREGSAAELVIAVGGDGTLHEVIQGLDLERHVLGLIPIGTGNDFAWMNGWPADPLACADRIAERTERRIDLGTWERGRFHNSIGIGFEAVVNRYSHRRGILRGPAVYVAALLRALARSRTWPVTVDWDGGSHHGAMLSASVALGRRVGGLFVIAPDARNDDGALDLVLAGELSPLRFLGTVAHTLRGRPAPGTVTARAPRFRVRCDDGIPVYADGEYVSDTIRELTIDTLAGALRTY